MTKAELIDRIARSRELPPDVTKKVIAKILDLTFAELAAYFVRSRITRNASPRFTYPKFGTFTKKRRSGRRGVNPRTLEPMEIEACDTVDFKPSAELKRLLNESSKPSSPAKSTVTKSRSKKKKKKKKAARSSTKRASKSKSKSTSKSTRSKSTAKTKTKTKTKSKARKTAPRSAGPGGRKLVTREEVELELPTRSTLLPDAPLQKVPRRRGKLDETGS